MGGEMTLVDRPVRSIVAAVADAAGRWSDADFPPRVRVLDAIVARTGYSLPVVEYALDRLFLSLDRERLEAVIEDELGSLDVLDTFVERKGRPRARALGIGPVCVVSSRTTIGVALVPAIFALCAKCDVMVKDREDSLIAAFFSTLAQELDEFRTAARAQAWEGSDPQRALDAFACVVAFGSDETLAAIAGGLPHSTRFIGYGAKASAGYVALEALASQRAARDLAERAARDLTLYDTEGCLSLHALFVERGGTISPEEFAALLARAVERACVEFPPGEVPSGSFRVAATRDMAAFRAAIGRGSVYADAAGTYCITLDPPVNEPPAFAPRTLGVHGVDSPEEALAYVREHRLALEAIAVASPRPDVVAAVRESGAARIAAFGEMQSPQLGDFHGGRPRIAEFVRWISDET